MRFSRFLGLLLIISAAISMGNSSAQNQIEANDTSRYLESIQPQPYANTTNIHSLLPTLALVAAKESYDSGYNAFEQGNYDLAKNFFGKVIDNAEIALAYSWFNKGTAYHSLNQYSNAIDAFNKSIEIDPQFKEAWNNKGESLKSQGNYDEAIKAFDKAIEIDPNYTNAIEGRQEALREKAQNG
jgi:tetratricopeptide (TPR) repeat protein